MNKTIILAGLASLALIGCDQASDSEHSSSEAIQGSDTTIETVDESAVNASTDAPGDNATGAGLDAIPAAMPKLAYAYGMSFELASQDIGRLMRRHADRCEQQGPQSCRIVGMDLSGSAERDDVRGTLQLAVAANHARAVSSLLEDEASDLGAEQTATTIGSEEVSKTIVDTEARIRSREELRDRLLEVLKTRRGSVEELVEAERQVAAVNEEIDQAKSWLAETQGRVAFSRMDIDYAPRAAVASGFTAPIASAFGSLGTVMGYVIAALILLGAVLAPVAGIAWIVRTLDRRKAGVEQGA